MRGNPLLSLLIAHLVHGANISIFDARHRVNALGHRAVLKRPAEQLSVEGFRGAGVRGRKLCPAESVWEMAVNVWHWETSRCADLRGGRSSLYADPDFSATAHRRARGWFA